MQLGMHTYSLYHHGVAEDWAGFELPWERQMDFFQMMEYVKGLGLEGLHLDAKALDSLDPDYLQTVKQMAQEMALYLEFNFALKSAHYDAGVQFDIHEGIKIARAIGSDTAKIRMNIKRPHPIAASMFHPDVNIQLENVIQQVKNALPFVESCGIRLALENHTDAFSDEVLWVLDQIDHPLVGACIDTVNGIHLTENPMEAVKNLAPRAFTNHFRDNKIEITPWGLKISGAAVGEGDLDMKKAYKLIRRNPDMNRINIELDLDCPKDDMQAALTTEKDALVRSIHYCRDVLAI